VFELRGGNDLRFEHVVKFVQWRNSGVREKSEGMEKLKGA
jgi:hypothetical protein